MEVSKTRKHFVLHPYNSMTKLRHWIEYNNSYKNINILAFIALERILKYAVWYVLKNNVVYIKTWS